MHVLKPQGYTILLAITTADVVPCSKQPYEVCWVVAARYRQLAADRGCHICLAPLPILLQAVYKQTVAASAGDSQPVPVLEHASPGF